MTGLIITSILSISCAFLLWYIADKRGANTRFWAIMGAFVGSRPDYKDYSINLDLLQYGAYLGHELLRQKGGMKNSLAFIEQTNQSKTDRRFIYLQHSSCLT